VQNSRGSVNVATAERHNPAGDSAKGVHEIAGLALACQDQIHHDVRCETAKFRDGIAQRLPIPENLPRPFSLRNLRLSAMKHRDLVALRDQVAGYMGANKSGASDEKNFHTLSLSIQPAVRCYSGSMLGIDPRAARAAWTVFLIALVVAAAYTIRVTLVVFMIALLFAYLLTPLVEMVQRFTPKRISPGIALVIVYLALIGVIVALAVTVGSRIVDEANNLAVRLPDLLKNRDWINQIPMPEWMEPVRARIVQWLQAELDNGGQDVLPYVKSLGGQLVSGAKYVVYLILIPILAFFFLKDGHQMREQFVAGIVEESRRPVVDGILGDINRLLGEYIRALVLLSVSGFITYVIFLSVTGAPYAVLLSGVAAIGEFLPVVGPAAAGAIALLVTGLAGYNHLLALVIFWIIFRMFQDYVVSPYLMGRGVELNPVLVLFGVLAGEQIAGVTGMFFSVPVIATLRVLFVRLQRSRRGELVTSGEK